MKHFILSTILCLSFSLTLAQPAGTPTKTITDDGAGTGTATWSKDTVYILSGFVFVNDGQTLTIEAGTVIKGAPGQSEDASALIVARGGKIMAMGTAAEPIIFTAEGDDVTNPFDIVEGETGLWGGVIILGNAGLNSDPGESAIEGIPTDETRGLYGGDDDEDNSGVFKYVSIRYGGTNIGANNEINGLTLGGVGSKTEVHHVEVIYNNDDGVEFFGGTVNTSYLAVAFCDDDSYDYDEGFRGKGQFWFTILSEAATSDFAGEHDGGTSPETAMPFATPVIYNATYIGKGSGDAFLIRDNAGGIYANSIFTEFGGGVNIELLGNGSESSFDRFEDGSLAFKSNIFWNVDGNVADDILAIDPAKFGGVSAGDSTSAVNAANTAVKASFAGNNNTVADPMFRVPISENSYGVARESLYPVPGPGSPAGSDLADLPANDDFFVQVPYKGAFGGSEAEFWLRGWTFLDQLFYFPSGGVTSIDDQITVEQSFRLYPNPATSRFAIELDQLGTEAVQVSILNPMGQTVYAEEVKPVSESLKGVFDIQNLSPAVYILKLTQAGKLIGTKRVIKQ